MNPIKHTLFSGLLACLVTGPITLGETSLQSKEPEVWVLDNIFKSEPVLIKLSLDNRKSLAFKGNYGRLISTINSSGARIESKMVGEDGVYFVVDLGELKDSVEVESFNVVLSEMEMVESVFPVASFNLKLKDLDKLKMYSPKEAVPDRKLYGLKSKKKDFKPDLDASYVEGEILIKYLEELPGQESYKSSSQGATDVKARYGAKAKHLPGLGNSRMELVQVDTNQGVSMSDILKELNQIEEIEYAEPNHNYYLDSIPNDSSYNALWAMPKIQAPTAWNVRTSTANGVVVAVTDSGMQYTHNDLQANRWVNPNEVLNGIDDDNNGYIDDIYGVSAIAGSGDPWDDMDQVSPGSEHHGTHVSGTIGAVGNNSQGVVGVAWQTKIMAVKIFNQMGGTNTAAIVAGLEYARSKGATVVNASWGGGGFSQLLKDKLEDLDASGIAFINAAGNGNPWTGIGRDHDTSNIYPSSYNLPNIMSVHSSNPVDGKPVYSDYGRWSVDIGAPGDGITSTIGNGAYGNKTGTSMAAPHVAGAYALAKSEFPWESHMEILDRLRFSADRVAGLDGLSMTGGRLNLSKALSELKWTPLVRQG